MNLKIINKMKVAILVYGINRSINKTYDSIKTNIFDPLLANSIEYDIFVHTYKLDTPYSNKRNEEKEAFIKHEEMNIFQANKIIFDDQNEIDKNHGDMNEYTKLVKVCDTNIVKNYVRALYSLKSVFEMIDTDKYDGCIIIRPDLLFESPLNIDDLVNSIQNNILYVPDFDKWHGYNDRFAFGSMEKITEYSMRYNKFLKYLRRKKHRFINAESFLKDTIQEPKDTHILFKRVRIDGRIMNDI
jgi:hypothetical protein